MAYLDEALKLDVRSLMALAMKGGKQSAYLITISRPTGQVICRDLRDSPDRVVAGQLSRNQATGSGALSGARRRPVFIARGDRAEIPTRLYQGRSCPAALF